MSLLMNQYGYPIILFDPNETKERIKGAEAYKVIQKNINFCHK
jgi:predicted CoA-binding protein